MHGARRVDADIAVVRAALAGWQEGPTDGRLCVDPHVLPDSGGADASPARWAVVTETFSPADGAREVHRARATSVLARHQGIWRPIDHPRRRFFVLHDAPAAAVHPPFPARRAGAKLRRGRRGARRLRPASHLHAHARINEVPTGTKRIG
jgi:hypothetical protein